MQDKLREAFKDKAAEAESGKAEVKQLLASITCLKAEVADQQQVVAMQQSKLQAASGLKAQLSQVERQLEEQTKVTAAREKQVRGIIAAKKNQSQEIASLKACLAEVCSASHLAFWQYLIHVTVLTLHQQPCNSS